MLRRGYFGPFALRESPAIFQPHWGYFRVRVIYTDWDNAAGTRLGSWSPKATLGAQPTPQTGCREVPRLPAGAPSNSCSARDAYSRVGLPGAHPTILPPSQRTAWLGLELLSPLPPLFPGRDGWGEVGNSGEVVMQLVAVGRETSLSWALGAEHPCSPPHWAPPSPKPAASEPARQKPGCFGVVRAT